ncbi:MAG: sugar ABC transporter ATP-binding protein, partial [Armatimonadota bacterium]|nr:sugar ABC transporter ATP-binding protein [Armatimonadota bacterium]
MLALRGAYKSFAGVTALADVSLDVRAGEVHALVGENGAGKSTLIRILAGVFPPDRGEVLLDGRPVSFPSPHHALARGIAAIHQEPSLCPSLSVLENIFLGCLPHGRFGAVAWRRAAERAQELLNLLDIRADLHVEAGGVSAAVQQTVEIARALARDARVLIMDEPTASLPYHEVSRLLRVVERLRQRGVAILYISHRLEEVFALADWVSVLRDGRRVASGPAAEFSREKLIGLMVGRDLAPPPPRAAKTEGVVALRVRNLQRRRANAAVSFVVRTGEIVGLAGLVGSGRTELARALFGLEPLAGGEVQVFGRRVALRNPRDALAVGIAYVPEDRRQHGLVLPLPVCANLSL